MDRDSIWFGYNRMRPFALHDRDYLYPGDAPLIAEGAAGTRKKTAIDQPAARDHARHRPAAVQLCLQSGQFFLLLRSRGQGFLRTRPGEQHLWRDPSLCSAARVRVTLLSRPTKFFMSPLFSRELGATFSASVCRERPCSLEITFCLDADRPALVGLFHRYGETIDPRDAGPHRSAAPVAGRHDLSPHTLAGCTPLSGEKAQGLYEARPLLATDYPRGAASPAGTAGEAR